MTIATARTAGKPLSEVQTKLLRDIFDSATEYDGPCQQADRDIRKRLDLWVGPHTREMVLNSADLFEIEGSYGCYQTAIADLTARLAPVAVEWVGTLPDSVASAVMHDEDNSSLVPDAVIERLFTVAGIEDRYVGLNALILDEPHTFAPEEPR